MREIEGKTFRYLRACADLLMPRTCTVCGRKLLSDERQLCIYCRTELPLTCFWKRGHNPMADKFNFLLQKELEQADRLERYAYACALFFYNNDTGFRNITHNIKYQGNKKAGTYYGRLLGKHLAESGHLSDIDLVIPVPLHWKREWKRGYNQAESIARGISMETGAELDCNILHRTRYTRTQTRLEVSEKLKNVKDAFTIKKDDTPERLIEEGIGHILLVDDVFTTGSTLLACFQALRTVFPPSIRISVATLGFVGRA